MPFNQDDHRERAMVQALNLDQRPDRMRHDEDGHLDLEWNDQWVRLLFECKSTTEASDYGTGRDTGIPQLNRWATMHFVFGTFEARDNVPQSMWYASPRAMRAWNQAERLYLQRDLALVDIAPHQLGEAEMVQVLGDKPEYTYEDLRLLLKDQWNAKTEVQPNLYDERADLHRSAKRAEHRYSRQAALGAVQARVQYLLARGATVNNRKIPAQYVREHAVLLEKPWARSLEFAVLEALDEEPPPPAV